MLQKINFDIEKMNQNDGSVSYYEKEGVIYGLSNPDHQFWKSFDQKEPMVVFACQEVEPGVYYGGLNFEYDISAYSDMEAYGAHYKLSKEGKPIESYDFKDMMEGLTPYGVADNIEQIKQYYKEIIDSDNPILISITEMRKENQPESGGWRWHKWGQYIGKKEPQSEYLYDEPEIESVYVYQVYALRPKLEKNLKQEISTNKQNKIK